MGEFHFIGVDALRARAIAALEEEMVDAADEVLTAAKVMTPELSEILERSERTSEPRVSAKGVSVRIIAGEGTDYAVIVHEKDAIHHDTGSAHFLARPVLAYIPRLGERVAQAAKRAY